MIDSFVSWVLQALLIQDEVGEYCGPLFAVASTIHGPIIGRLPYKFFDAQAPTRSSAFLIFSIELATLKRK